MLILDGATGTELDRRGVDVTLPLWSARALVDAPEVLEEVHADYLRAGADVIVTNTFRTHERSLARAGLPGNCFQSGPVAQSAHARRLQLRGQPGLGGLAGPAPGSLFIGRRAARTVASPF